MEISRKDNEQYNDILNSLPLEKVSKMDIVSKDRKIKLKDCIRDFLELELDLMGKETNGEQRLENAERARQRSVDVCTLLSEQVLRVCEYKGLTFGQKIENIENYFIMLSNLSNSLVTKNTSAKNYLSHLMSAFADLVILFAVVHMCKDTDYFDKEQLLFIALDALTIKQYEDKFIPREMWILSQKIALSCTKELYEELLNSLEFRPSQGVREARICLPECAIPYLSVLKETKIKEYSNTIQSFNLLRELMEHYKKADTYEYSISTYKKSHENTLMREEFIQEWRSMNKQYNMDLLPEFAFKLKGNLSHMGFIEIMKVPQDEKDEKYDNLENINIVILTDRVFVEKNIIPEDIDGESGYYFDMPGIKGLFILFRANGMLKTSDTKWSSNITSFSPLELSDELGFFPGGEEFATELQLQIFDEIKKQLHYQASMEITDDESLNEEPGIALNIDLEEEYVEEKNEEHASSFENRLIKYKNKCYEMFMLPEGHLPVGNVASIIEEIRKEIDIPQNVSLNILHPLSSHIGWRKVAQVIKKHFHCHVQKDTASTHFTVTRKVENKKLHAVMLAPKRNKYSKHAAFGTITSMLRKLHIDEEVFWNVVQGRFTPDQLINLNKEEYYQRLKDVSNKLI